MPCFRYLSLFLSLSFSLAFLWERVPQSILVARMLANQTICRATALEPRRALPVNSSSKRVW